MGKDKPPAIAMRKNLGPETETEITPAGAPEHDPALKAELSDVFNDWSADNHCLLAVGLCGDVEDLRLRLNAAFAKFENSSS